MPMSDAPVAPLAAQLRRASVALHKIDRMGVRAMTLLSIEEIEALAVCLISEGYPAMTADLAASIDDARWLDAWTNAFAFHPHQSAVADQKED